MEKEEATNLANGGEEEEEEQQKGDTEDPSPAAEKAADEEEEEVEEEEDEDERVSGQHLEELKAGLAALLPSSASGTNWLGVSREEETSSEESFEIISNPDSSEGSSCSGEFIETSSTPDEFQAVNDPTEEPQEDKSLESSTSEKPPSSGLSDVDLHGSGSGETLASSTELVFDARSESSNEPRNSDIMSVGSSGHSMDVNVCTDEDSDGWETLSSTDPSVKVRSSSPSSSTENFEKIFPHGSSDNEPSPSPIEYASDSEPVPSSEVHSSRNLSDVSHNASCEDIHSAEENKPSPVHRSPSPALLMPESAASSNVDLSVSQTDSMEKTNLIGEDQLSTASDAALSVNDVVKLPEEQSPKNKVSNELPEVQSSSGGCSGDLAENISVSLTEDSDNVENKSIGSVTQTHPEKLCDERAESQEKENEKESTELADNERAGEDERLQRDSAELSLEEKAEVETTNEAGSSDDSDRGLVANDLQHCDQDPHVVDSPVCDVPDKSEEIALEKPIGELSFKPSEDLPSPHDESSRDSSGDCVNESTDRSVESSGEASETSGKSGESADESSESAHELSISSDELDESGHESKKADSELSSADAKLTESKEASDASREESTSAPNQVLSSHEKEAPGDSSSSPQGNSAIPVQELDDSIKVQFSLNERKNESTSVPCETEGTLSSSASDEPQAPVIDGNSSVTDGLDLIRDKNNVSGGLTFLSSDVYESSQTISEQRYVENLGVIEEHCISSRIYSEGFVVNPNYESFRKRKTALRSEASLSPVEIDDNELPSGLAAPKKIYLGPDWTRDMKWRLDMDLSLVEKNGHKFELDTDYTCKFPSFSPPKASTEFASDSSTEVTEAGPICENENSSNIITKCDFSDVQKALNGFRVTDKICFESKNGCSVVFDCHVSSGNVDPCPLHYHCPPASLQDVRAQPNNQGKERGQLLTEAGKEKASAEGVVLAEKIDTYLIPGLNIELPRPSTPTSQRMLQVVMFVIMAVLTTYLVGMLFPPRATTIFEEASARDVIELRNKACEGLQSDFSLLFSDYSAKDFCNLPSSELQNMSAKMAHDFGFFIGKTVSDDSFLDMIHFVRPALFIDGRNLQYLSGHINDVNREQDDKVQLPRGLESKLNKSDRSIEEQSEKYALRLELEHANQTISALKKRESELKSAVSHFIIELEEKDMEIRELSEVRDASLANSLKSMDNCLKGFLECKKILEDLNGDCYETKLKLAVCGAYVGDLQREFHESELSQHKSQSSSLESLLSQCKASAQSLESNMKECRHEKKAIELEVTDLNSQLLSLSSNLSECQTARETTSSTLSQCQLRLEDAESDRATQHASTAERRDEFIDAETHMLEYTSAMEHINSKLMGCRKTLEERTQSLNEVLEQENSCVNTAKTTGSNLKGCLSYLNMCSHDSELEQKDFKPKQKHQGIYYDIDSFVLKRYLDLSKGMEKRK